MRLFAESQRKGCIILACLKLELDFLQKSLNRNATSQLVSCHMRAHNKAVSHNYSHWTTSTQKQCSMYSDDLVIASEQTTDVCLFVVYISDLKACGKSNYLIKFADDCTLLVPEHSDVSIQQEILYRVSWGNCDTKN